MFIYDIQRSRVYPKARPFGQRPMLVAVDVLSHRRAEADCDREQFEAEEFNRKPGATLARRIRGRDPAAALTVSSPRPIIDHPSGATPVQPQEVGQRPDERIRPVGRKAGGAAVEIGGQGAELVLELAE